MFRASVKQQGKNTVGRRIKIYLGTHSFEDACLLRDWMLLALTRAESLAEGSRGIPEQHDDGTENDAAD